MFNIVFSIISLKDIIRVLLQICQTQVIANFSICNNFSLNNLHYILFEFIEYIYIYIHTFRKVARFLLKIPPCVYNSIVLTLAGYLDYRISLFLTWLTMTL